MNVSHSRSTSSRPKSSPRGRRCAPRRAAAGLGADIDVLVPYVESFAEAIETPAGDVSIAAEPYRELVMGIHLSARVRLCVCRRLADVLNTMLPEHSTVVVGGRH